MLVLRHEVIVKNEFNKIKFINTILDWIRRSPHSVLAPAIDELTMRGDDFNIFSKDNFEQLTSKNFVSDEESLVGLRYKKIEEQYIWLTSIVFRKCVDSSALISIEIDCESKKSGRKIPYVHIPVIFRKIIPWIIDEGSIKTTILPHNISQTDIDYATKLLSGKIIHKYPIVYISSTYGDTHVVNPTILARKLFGVAHVFVEPNRAFSNRLRINLADSNPHSGAIGIYWNCNEYYDLLFRNDDPHDDFIEKIVRKIINGLKLYRVSDETRWEYLEQKITAKQINYLKNNSEATLEQYVEAFDKENKSLQKDINKYQADNLYLKSEIARLSKRVSIQGLSFSLGECMENYSGEIHDFILEILNTQLQNYSTNTRGYEIITSLLAANKCIGNKKEIQKTLKAILSNFGRQDTNTELQKLGLVVEDAGKHLKLHWKGNDNSFVTLAKTPSDYRTQLNTFSDAKKVLF